MKKILLPCTLFLALNFSSLLAQIPNAGFENWSTVGSYMNPDNWSTLNNTTATYSLFTATKATPGNPGTAYLKLTSKTINGSVVNGIAVSGKLDTITLKPKSGFPYTQRSSTFAGKWQHMIYGASQGNVSVLLSRWNTALGRRDTVASAAVTLAGMAMSWSNFGMSLNYVDSLHYPDSCLIVLQASGTAPTNNDYLWIDGLALSGTVAIVSSTVNTVGLEKNNLSDADFVIYPNPSENTLHISSPNKIILKAEVYNLLGQRLLIKNDLAESKTELDISELQSSSYLLKLSHGEGTQTFNFIKK